MTSRAPKDEVLHAAAARCAAQNRPFAALAQADSGLVIGFARPSGQVGDALLVDARPDVNLANQPILVLVWLARCGCGEIFEHKTGPVAFRFPARCPDCRQAAAA